MSSAIRTHFDAVTARNDWMRAILPRLARGAARFIAGLFRSLQRAQRKRALFQDLTALNDHQLKDIGLTRLEVPGVVSAYVADECRQSAHPAPPSRSAGVLRAAIRSLRVWRTARATARELRRLDRRLLADIGVRHDDIVWLSRDLAERSLDDPTPANDNRRREVA